MHLKEIDTPDVNKVVGYLDAIGDVIRTGELKWSFDARLFEYEGTFSDVESLIKEAYPDSKPELANITEGTIRDLAETFKHELGRWLSGVDALRLLTPVTEMRGEMWLYLNACVDLEHSRVFEYFTQEPLDSFRGGGLVGNLAAVILNETQKRCLLLSGGDCD
jgi:hypothetical protein